MGQCIRQAGLLMEDITGMTYNPLTKVYRLNPNDVGINYLVHAVKPG
jgi:2-polyprenyl-6-hydroxyphenyl methylase/3-demethylubiquinone-9 3-methyltransferase